MLSICIPVYNYDVHELCNALLSQADAEGIFTEIILVDDGSDIAFREINQSLLGDRVRYHQLTMNHGRGFARNSLASLAKGDFLLFLDCDSKLKRNDFLKKYLESAQLADIICGGRVYEASEPGEEYLLHWTYGSAVESRNDTIRNEHPYDSFMTNNFLVEKSVFKKIAFTEKLKGYGHEDTLFGYNAKQNKISIRHIDNPVLHGKLESNKSYIDKTEEGVKNLVLLQELETEDFANTVRLLRSVKKMKQLGIWKSFQFAAPAIHLHSRNRLIGNSINLRLFDLFKLSAFAIEERQRKKAL